MDQAADHNGRPEGSRKIGGTVKLLREYIRESLMYHSTAPDNVSAIQQAGLQTGRESVHTAAGSWADDHYNTRPIYVSVERGKYAGQSLEVDTSGLTLVADLPHSSR